MPSRPITQSFQRYSNEQKIKAIWDQQTLPSFIRPLLVSKDIGSGLKTRMLDRLASRFKSKVNLPFFCRSSARKSRDGMALILTLAILAILSILLVAFVSTASLDRGATQSYASRCRPTRLLSEDLMNCLLNCKAKLPTLLSPPVSSGGNNLYIPIAAPMPCLSE